MRPFSRKHLLRDDLESIVHVLTHHVLRYRPAGFPTVKLAKTLEDIFDNHFVVDGQSEGGERKADYFRGGAYFTTEALIASTLHPQLVALMSALRGLFYYFYQSPNVVRASQIPQSIVDAALRALDTADKFIAVFKEHLEADGWPENDGAIDQLPPKELPTQLGATLTNSNREKRKSAQEGGRISKARRQSEHSSVSQALRSVEESQQPTA
ncbi:hypothetical protein OF83DRAFT_245998 [Amylostereum chailletii]|nr:hypothetical protein OF83DRAFT_245998 [Amylostereum chailletii]